MFSVTTNTYILPSTTKTVAKLVHYYNICKKWRCFFEKKYKIISFFLSNSFFFYTFAEKLRMIWNLICP